MARATRLRQTRRVGGTIAVLIYTSLLLWPRPAAAYSVLAHEAMVDSMWDDAVVKLLRRRFPGVSADGLEKARAFAYGGSLIQDLGYYPFGSRLFTNLTHYVRSGDFVAALLRDAQDVNEYAFALGALAHYASDNSGHPIAVNRAVPLVYPKLRRKVGDVALYADSPARHLMVEFAFDVPAGGEGRVCVAGVPEARGIRSVQASPRARLPRDLCARARGSFPERRPRHGHLSPRDRRDHSGK